MMDNFLNDEENLSARLTDAIDLNDLRKNEEVCFEVKDEDEAQPDEPTSNYCFSGEELCNNLYVPDDEDDEDEDDEDDESTPFEKLARKMADVCPLKDGGILKQVLRQGTGPLCTEGSVARIHYNAYNEYDVEPFDSTRLNDKVKRLRVGYGTAIEGLEYAVSTMRKGELSRFLISAEYGYLSMGAMPRIPNNASVLFEIELLSFVEQASVDDYFGMTEDEKRDVPWTDIDKLYHNIVKEARELFEANKYRDAFRVYKKASTVLENRRLKNEEEEREWERLLLRVYLNLATCCLKLSHSGRCVSYARKCLEFDKNNTKALYLQGKALHQLGEFERARDLLKRAQRMKPANREINEELLKLERDLKNYKFTEKSMAEKMFSKPLERTEQEEEQEVKRQEDAEEKSLHCSDKFKQVIHEKLSEFKMNRDLLELPLPHYQFTVGEIQHILEAAEDMGLQARVRGSGQSAQLRVYKTEPVEVS